MAFRSIDRTSQFYHIFSIGKQIRIDLHPNKTDGTAFRIRNREEGEALIARIQVAIDALDAGTPEKDSGNLPISGGSK